MEVHAAGGQHGSVRSESSLADKNSAVTEETLVTLLTQTLQQLAAMVWELHSSFITWWKTGKTGWWMKEMEPIGGAHTSDTNTSSKYKKTEK